MSLLTGNADAASEFSKVMGRYPTPDEVPNVDWGYAHNSMETFPGWVRSVYGQGGPAYNATASMAPVFNASSPMPTLSGGDSNQFLAGLIPFIPQIGNILGGILGGAGKAVPGVVGGAAAGAAPDILKGLLGGATQPTGKAPTATFFGGECPPGRVLRRKPGARDVCIKKPRMNPFNPRALARADRRVVSFARRSKTILQGLGYHVGPRKKSVAKKTRRR